MLTTTAVALLTLASAEPGLAVDLRLVPPATGALEAPGAAELALPPTAAPPSPDARAGALLGASLGVALADLASVGLMATAVAHSCFLERCPAPSWVGPVFLAGAASHLFLAPALGVWFARSAYGGGNDPGRAYWIAFAVRLVAMGLLAAGPVGAALYVAEELVVVPYVIVSALTARPARTLAFTVPPVRPERDPALAWRLR